MSELTKSEDSFDQTMQKLDKLRKYLQHNYDHVVLLPVKIKHYDDSCETCQAESRRINKRSENAPPGRPNGEPFAIASVTTVLCYRGIHDECLKNYIMEKEQIEVQCICKCHSKKSKRKRKATSS
jgi:hypothetical protein